MTNHWIDFKNADVILVMGSNAAENHPIGFKWIMEAKKKGAKLISVDPRFTRSSARADIYAPLRPGTDIAFINGMIRYIIENKLYDEFYVKNYTNATHIVNKDFKLTAELDGVFSGYDESKRKYDKKAWDVVKGGDEVIKKDPSMSDPYCAFQLLKKHVSRYTPELVERITGTPKDSLIEVYKTYSETGKPDKAATILYAMGWTQHTVGTQNIRAMSIVQMLLGNIGIAGGGVNALRGESNVQGSTDHALLFHILPGYLRAPNEKDTSFKVYNESITPKTKEPQSANWPQNLPKYSASLMKAYFGANATKENEFGFNMLPKIDEGQNCSWLALFDAMAAGKFKGFFAWGQNPACSGSNAGKVRGALAKLEWMVNVNLFDNETGSFWRGPGAKAEEIKTEVFMLPVASSIEKEGSITNSGRWAQWRYKAVNPPGEAKSDTAIINELYFRVKKLYEKEGGAYPDPVLKISWNYGFKGPDGKIKAVDIHAVAKEINGYANEDFEIEDKKTKKKTAFAKDQQLASFAMLQDDGKTTCGNWIYCGSYSDKGNMMARRALKDPTGLGLYPEWAWCWPVNRRIIYNRASADLDGKPRNPKRPLVYWNGTAWVGDVPDGPWPPISNKEEGRLPFIMKPTGVGHIFGAGLNDGPFPEHYEPLECPIQVNPMFKKHRINPTAKLYYKAEGAHQVAAKDGGKPEDIFATCDTRFPYVATTYRVSEHWQTGVLTRHLPWQLEMQPQSFVEMGMELAKEKGIKNGDTIKVSSVRGEVLAKAVVTDRIKPFKVMDNTVHMVGLPYHFGWQYPEDGSGFDSANLLTPTIGDANTSIPETKAFMVNIERA